MTILVDDIPEEDKKKIRERDKAHKLDDLEDERKRRERMMISLENVNRGGLFDK